MYPPVYIAVWNESAPFYNFLVPRDLHEIVLKVISGPWSVGGRVSNYCFAGVLHQRSDNRGRFHEHVLEVLEGTWHMAHDTGCMAHGTWHTAHVTWRMRDWQLILPE